MSRISKTQIYAICWLSSQNKTIDKISEEIKLSVDEVTKVLEKHFSNQNKNIKTGSEKVDIKNNNLMINQTSGKNNPGVSIMTKEASEKADAMRDKTTSKILESNKAIFRPKNNK